MFAQAIRPPTVPEGTSRLRLAVMASHTKGELREAARVIAQAALRNGFRPSSSVPVAAAQSAAQAAAGRRRACSTATPRSRCRRRRETARAVRHGHRHRRRQDRRRRRDRRRAARARRAGRRVQAGRHRARRGARARLAARPRAARRGRGRAAPRTVTPHAFGPPVSPHLAAELAGDRARRRRDGRRRQRGGGRGPRRRAGRARASAACSSRSRPTHTVRDLAVALGFPLVVAARPGLGTISHTLLDARGGARGRPRASPAW